MARHGWLKISHHEHSGRLRPHEHTSYLPLALLVLTVGVIMGVLSIGRIAGASPGPAAGSIGLSGTVPAKSPPKQAATIASPGPGQHFTTSPITVSGTCTAKTLVEIFKNNIFAGSTPCKDNGTYSLEVDLLIGKNELIARVYDVLNQAGPDSSTITVYYDAALSQAAGLSPLNFKDAQLVLNTDAVFRGMFPDQLLNVPVNIIGGTPPYAVNVEWGDSKNSVIARNTNVTFNAGHKYSKPGTYQIIIQASDAKGRVAFLTIAAIINGQPQAATVSNVSKNTTNKLLVLWPLYTMIVTLLISFWLGEQREKRILRPPSGPMYHAPVG
ncbi:MAG TPA: hypothetical protein VFX84_02420 [Candidatus Saccharimonadales bacterium]|nr:hypothetical protein [Candidatus Saccharimonadales bacterium]